jgi:hypothetical protein
MEAVSVITLPSSFSPEEFMSKISSWEHPADVNNTAIIAV